MANRSIPTIELKKIQINFSKPTKRQLQLVVNTEKEVLKNIPVLQAGLAAFTHQPERPLHLSKGQTLRIRLLPKYDGKFQFKQGTGTDGADVTLSFIDAKKLKLSVLRDYDHIIRDPGRADIKVTLAMAANRSTGTKETMSALSNPSSEGKDEAATEPERLVARTPPAGRSRRQRTTTGLAAMTSTSRLFDDEGVEDVRASARTENEHDEARLSAPVQMKIKTAAVEDEEAYMDKSADAVGADTEGKYVSEVTVGERPVKNEPARDEPAGKLVKTPPKGKAEETSATTPEEVTGNANTAERQSTLRPPLHTEEAAERLASETSSQFFSGASNTIINGGIFVGSAHYHYGHGETTSLPGAGNSPTPGKATSNQTAIFALKLPARPRWFIGRDDAVEDIVTCVLGAASERPARIAILGDGGFGKTTLALAALYDARIEARYGRNGRMFVSCEGATTPDLLITALANGLYLEAAQRDSHILHHILSQLQSTVGILCLDNFETPWDPADYRRPVEELLRHLAGISSLTLLLTMRGTQKPSGIDWEPRFLPLSPLDPNSAAKMFLTLSGQSTNFPIDEHAQRLLEAVEYIPLAISIIAQLVQDGESPQLLLQRWQEEGTAVLSTGVDDRAYALDASIRLSVSSPRMRAVPFAEQLLAMVALLPAGILESGDIMDELNAALPAARIHLALQTLKRVALIQGMFEQPGAVKRYRLLSPIAQWTARNLPLSDEMHGVLAVCYSSFISTRRDRSDPSLHPIIVPELLNIRTVLHATLDRGVLTDDILVAVVNYSHWSVYIGGPSTEIVLSAISCATDHDISPILFGDLQNSLGIMYFHLDKFDAAETALKDAIVLHQQAGATLQEATDRLELGDLYIHQGRPAEAQSALEAALVLSRQCQNTIGEANSQYNLGRLYLQQGRLDEAQSTLEAAHVLFRQCQSTLGEANSQHSLGRLYLQQDRLNEAQNALEAALVLSRQCQYTLVEADIQGCLGSLYFQQDRLDKAQSAFEAALTVRRRQCQDTHGEANTQGNLGLVLMQRGRLDEAQTALEAALVLHRKYQDTDGKALAQYYLGWVHMQQGRLDEAQRVLEARLVAAQQSQNTVVEAETQHLLQDLYAMQEEASQLALVS